MIDNTTTTTTILLLDHNDTSTGNDVSFEVDSFGGCCCFRGCRCVTVVVIFEPNVVWVVIVVSIILRLFIISISHPHRSLFMPP